MNQLVTLNTAPAMTVSDVERVANAIAKGGLFGSKDPYAVLTLCLLAQAEGQHPAVVFRDYHIIQGKPAKKAEAMLRDFINAGGKVEWHQLDDTCADATFTHPAGSARIEWTVDRARKAGISTPMWSKYPRQMLRSRAISEGIRTVYPGATSGLYEEGEVATITGGDFTPHDSETGEIIEAPGRDKVPGIHAIKKRLGTLLTDGNKATSLEDFNTLVGQHKTDLTAIKDANHEWWTGDGEDFEGFKAFIKRRREELESSLEYQLLVSTLNELETPEAYKAWLAKNGDVIGDLDGEESRRFEEIHDVKFAILGAMSKDAHATANA